MYSTCREDRRVNAEPPAGCGRLGGKEAAHWALGARRCYRTNLTTNSTPRFRRAIDGRRTAPLQETLRIRIRPIARRAHSVLVTWHPSFGGRVGVGGGRCRVRYRTNLLTLWKGVKSA